MDFTYKSHQRRSGHACHLLLTFTLFIAVHRDISMATKSCKICDHTFSCGKGEFVSKEKRADECCHLTCKQCGSCGLGTNEFLNFMLQECQNDTDTVCCHTDEDIVVNGKCQKPTPPTTTLSTSAREEKTITGAAESLPLAKAGNSASTTTNSSSVPSLLHVTLVLPFLVFLVFK